MATNKLIKEKIVVADMIFGMGSTTDSRGTQSEINGNFIPFSDTQSINQALLDRHTKDDMTSILEYYAAINVEQLNNLMLNTIALQANVLELDNSDVYNPATNYNPATKLYVDIAISDRFTGVVSGDFTSADGKTITVTGGLVTSIV